MSEPNELLQKAISYERLHNYECALQIYNQLIDADSKNPLYYYRRGMLYKCSKKLVDKSIDDLRIANVLEPENQEISFEYLKSKIEQLLGANDIMAACELSLSLSVQQFPNCTMRIKEEMYQLKERCDKAKEMVMPTPDTKQIKLYVEGLIESVEKSDKIKTEIKKLISTLQPVDSIDPFYYTCPISLDLFKEPIITSGGFSYEKSLLMEHINKNGAFDPSTRIPIDANLLYPNNTLQKAVSIYKSKFNYCFAFNLLLCTTSCL